MQLDDLSNPQLVTIVVALLGGEMAYIDREEIAIMVNEIAPGRFNWRRYPEWIDLETVSVALRDAKKPKNGGLLTGTNSTGWMLSPTGLQWLSKLELPIVQDSQVRQHRKASISAVQEAECARMRSTRSYQLFISGRREQITLQDFYQFARVNEYFREKARVRRYTIIDNSVAGDKHLSDLWSYLKEKFPEEMR